MIKVRAAVCWELQDETFALFVLLISLGLTISGDISLATSALLIHQDLQSAISPHVLHLHHN